MYERLDGRYGWAVVFAHFVVCALILGTTRTSGVWYVYFRDEYNQTHAATSTIALTQRLTESSTALVFSFLAERYGSRPVMLVGAVVVVAGAIGSVFATSIADLTVTFGALGGLGSAMVLYPSSQMIPKYFDNRLAIASALGFSGMSFGPLLFPFMIEFSVIQYGLNGSFFILAATYMHLFIAAVLMRPAKSFFTREYGETDTTRPTFKSMLKRYQSCLSHKSLYLYYMAWISVSTSTANFLNFQQAHVKDSGISDPTLLASLTAIGSVFEIISRIGLGFFLHSGVLLPYRLHQLAAITFAVVLFVYPYFSHYWIFAAVSAVLGVLRSALGVAIMPTLRLLVGIDLASPAFGLICLPVMLSHLSVLLSGFLRDITGSFAVVYYGCGALLALGVCLVEVIAWDEKSSVFHKCMSLFRRNKNTELAVLPSTTT